MKNQLFVFSIIVVFMSIGGCAATIKDTSKVQYVKDGFNGISLQDGGLALLPVLAGAGQEGYRRPLADSLDSFIGRYLPSVRYVTWKDAGSKMNTGDLTPKYESAINTYRTTAIVDKVLMEEIGTALGVRYLLQVSLQDFHKSSSMEYSGLSGRMESRDQMDVNAFAQIWDTQTGDVVWEGYGGSSARSGEFTFVKGGYETYSGAAAKGLISRLPGATTKKR